MNRTILTAGIAALAALTAGSALAQQPPGRGARADADGDGRVSRAEFVDARIARLTAIDANGDGVVSAEERRSAIDTRRNQRASARFEALDKNGDGQISREEFMAPREPHAGRGDHPRMRQGGPRGPRSGWRHGPGAERGPNAEARAPMAIADVRTRLNAQFDRIDANRDGYITVEERRAAHQAMRGERGERRAERMARRQASPSTAGSE